MFNVHIDIFKKVQISYTVVPYKEQLNMLAYADDIAFIGGKNEIEIKKTVEMENIARKTVHFQYGRQK